MKSGTKKFHPRILGTLGNFGPISWQAKEIIGALLASESQSYRVTDTQGYSVYRCFACRGINENNGCRSKKYAWSFT